jgi:hypothetical protein
MRDDGQILDLALSLHNRWASQLLSLGDTFAMALLFKPRSPPLSAPASAEGLARRSMSGGYLRG